MSDVREGVPIYLGTSAECQVFILHLLRTLRIFNANAVEIETA
jgi:hypothetical protein